MKELREMEEANLVAQDKLVRTKNERVPRLSDLTMRPVFAGRKTQGNLESRSTLFTTSHLTARKRSTLAATHPPSVPRFNKRGYKHTTTTTASRHGSMWTPIPR